MRLLYFAWVKEKVGRASEDIALPAEIATIAELIVWLKARGPEFAKLAKLFAQRVAGQVADSAIVVDDTVAADFDDVGDRIFSSKEVAEMRAAELDGEEG